MKRHRAKGLQMSDLYELDLRLLAELRVNPRRTNLELAARLPLSHSAISRRIARLEREGVLRGYRAEVDPFSVGLTIRAFVGVQRDPKVSVDLIGRDLRAIEAVTGCWIVTEEQDFFLDVSARDMAHFSDVLLNHIQKVSGVVATRIIFVLADVTALEQPNL